ncbi:MAG: FAD-dependent oxidoreductase [Acidimicrobiales bacterium]|nr:FAD-dependent oxidoreductase [Acidimicrobiales bacterium]
MIAVIGAGPAGLAVAWQLTRDGHDAVVIEASSHVGGMSGSRTVSGIRVDLGSHRLPPAMPAEIRGSIEELVELQERPRRGRVRLDGRWLPVPLQPVGALRGLAPSTGLRMAAETATSPLRRPKADTYAAVLRASHGDTAFEQLHAPFAWKLWDTDPDHLAGELARRRLGASAGQVVGAALRRVMSPPTFLYPRRGFGALSEAMAELIPEIRLDTKVTGLIEHEDRVTVGLADGRIVTVDHVFSTLPAGRTAVWLALVEPDEVVLPTRAVVLVYLTLDRRPYTEFDAHLLPDRTVLPTRVSEPANYRDSAADPPDRTVLCAEVPCWVDDAVWGASDEELGRRVADDLVRSGLPDPRATAVETIRMPSVHPVMTGASLAALDRAERALQSSGRVTVLGRQGLFTPDTTHHVLQMGFAAARCVGADGGFDHDAWRRARDDFRAFVVES